MSRHRPYLAVLAAVSVSVALGCASTSGSAAPSRASSSGTAVTSAVQQQALSKVRQRATLAMHPQIAHPGSGDKPAAKAMSGMTAQLKPARKGRKVVLQRKAGAGWSSVKAGRQNGKGRVDFVAPYKVKGKIRTYRVMAPRAGDLAKVTSPGVKTSRWGRPDFDDQFSGPVLDPVWDHQMQGYQSVSKRSCSKVDPTATAQGGGVVKVGVIDDPTRVNGLEPDMCRHGFEGDNAPYNWRYNGHIQTEGEWSFTYGYAAARIKFNKLRGQHGSLFLWPEPGHPLEGPARRTGAEIDVIEWFGKNRKPSPLTSFIYYYPDDGKEGVTGKKVPNSGYGIPNIGRYGKDWEKKYHVFSVEWTPKRYVFRIDGKETLRVKEGVSGVPQFLNLSNLASDYELKFLGDGDPGDDADYGSKLPQKMSVDWVRVWDRRS